MFNRWTFLLLLAFFIGGCADSESSARELYNKGMTLQQENKIDEAIEAYRRVVSLYPGTETAVEVNKILMSLTMQGGIKEELRGEMDPAKVLDDLRATLYLFKLDTGRYPSTEDGLKALMVRPEGYSGWLGPYMTQSKAGVIDDFIYENKDDSDDIVLMRKSN